MKTTHFGYQKDSPEKSRLTKGILMSLVLVMSRASIIKREQRWGIMSTFPLPMTVMYNAQVFSCFFTTEADKVLMVSVVWTCPDRAKAV